MNENKKKEAVKITGAIVEALLFLEGDSFGNSNGMMKRVCGREQDGSGGEDWALFCGEGSEAGET